MSTNQGKKPSQPGLGAQLASTVLKPVIAQSFGVSTAGTSTTGASPPVAAHGQQPAKATSQAPSASKSALGTPSPAKNVAAAPNPPVNPGPPVNINLEATDTKIGFELEGLKFELKDLNPQSPGLTEDSPILQKNETAAKGSTLRFFAVNNAEPLPEELLPTTIDERSNSDHWRPTAELQGNFKIIQLELIYGGLKGTSIDIARSELGQVGAQMVALLSTIKTPGLKVFIQPANIAALTPPVNAKWFVKWPITDRALSLHCTAGIPLAGISGFLSLNRGVPGPEPLAEVKKKNGILFSVDKERSNLKPVNLSLAAPMFNFAQIKWSNDITPQYGQASIEGLLILICSYTKAAQGSPSNSDIGLKTKTPLMPRTDFAGMLQLVTGMMAPASALEFRTKLPSIIAVLDGLNAQNPPERYFNWGDQRTTPAAATLPIQSTNQAPKPSSNTAPLAPPPPPPPPPPVGRPAPKISTAPRVDENNLAVSTWLTTLTTGVDLLAEKDRTFREAQIGALGKKVEALIGAPGKLMCPILELRGIGACQEEDLKAQPNFLQKLETRIREVHAEAAALLRR